MKTCFDCWLLIAGYSFIIELAVFDLFLGKQAENDKQFWRFGTDARRSFGRYEVF